MTLGTAKIEATNGLITLSYMPIGNFTIGQQLFGDHREGWNAALRFCRENGLRVLEG
jgi:hypothetical protein